MFNGCSNLTVLDTRCSMTKSMKSCNRMFMNTGITTIPSTFHLAGQSSGFIDCFKNCTKLTTIESDLEFSHNTKEVAGMFENTDISTIPSSLYITSGIVNASRMFADCKKLFVLPKEFRFSENIPYGQNGQNGQITVSEMFCGCDILSFIRNEQFKLPPAYDFSKMFYKCVNLTLDITAIWPEEYFNGLSNTSLINLTQMFAYDELIIGIPPAEYLWFLDQHYKYDEECFIFDNCFYDCISLFNFQHIPLYWGGTIYPINYTVLRIAPTITDNTQQLFNLTPEDGDQIEIIWGDTELPEELFLTTNREKISNIKNTSHSYTLEESLTITKTLTPGLVLSGSTNNWYADIPLLNEPEFEKRVFSLENPNLSIYYLIKNAYTNVYKNFKTIIIKNCKAFNCGLFNNHIVKIFSLSKYLESCRNMFADSPKLLEIYKHVTLPEYSSDFSNMFFNCTQLTGLSDNFQFGRSARYANSMFENCLRLKTINNFFIPNSIQQMEYMFKDCQLLNADISQLLSESFKQSFRDYSLSTSEEINLTNTVINMRSAFEQCSYITGTIPIKHLWRTGL